MDKFKQMVKELFTHNWHLKVLSLVLAALSFYAIRNATSFEVPYEIPLVVEVEKGLAILDQDPRTVEVTFRGSQEDLLRLEPSRLKAVLRLKSTKVSGRAQVPIEPGCIEGAPATRVVKIKPAQASLTFDHETEKVLQVAKPTTLGKPLIGHVELDYEPKTVLVRGSKLRLQDKEVLDTEPVDVDGRVESFTKQARVLPPKDMWISQVDPAAVTVRINIVTESATREWTNVLVRAILNPGEVRDVYVEPAAVKVTVQGRAELLQNLTGNGLAVFVDCAGLDPSGTYELPVSAHLPPGLDVTSVVEPETVKVIVREARR